jgi:hypothetical protein
VQSKFNLLLFYEKYTSIRINSNARFYVRMLYMKREKKYMYNMWRGIKKVEEMSYQKND